MLLGAIEAGGTKFICAIGTLEGEILEKQEFPTLTPDETMKNVFKFFKDKEIHGMGIGSFGPVGVNKKSKEYGYILNTPKPYWGQFDLLGTVKEQIKCPIVIDTDVNGAALAESLWGAGKGLSTSIYLTIGTGIGGGAVVNGDLIHGLLHPEMGHILMRKHPDDHYEGKCPFHKDCFEGLAAGPSIEARYGSKAYEMPESDPIWDYVSYYIAQALVNYTYILSPEKIILGGGVMKQKHLFKKIHTQYIALSKGYIEKKELLEAIDQYIVYPELGDFAGTFGALALARKSIAENASCF